ncbi:MAG TPA: DsbE family thiol:disulfide interchange protein [Steroidobacteraceae bacterium]|nr:DsbE family thiol:disulfide interchange protein [Steroidobacteraceae bacterium]
MKNRFIIAPLAFAVLALVLLIGILRAPRGERIIPSVLIGKPVPAFDLPNLTNPGTKVSSKALLGKPYVLNVWGTWCVTCRQEHDTLLKIQEMNQVPLIGVNWRDEDTLALQWLSDLGNPYSQIAVDREGRLAIDLGVSAAPESFLVDANGVIVHKHSGALTMEVWKRDFEPLIAGSPRAGS